MKLFLVLSIIFIASCIERTTADDQYTYTLDKAFKMDVFIPYYSYFTMTLATLSNKDIIVSNTTSTTFKLTNGILSSLDSSSVTYFLKNQTGFGYPSYVLKQGRPRSGDAVILRASRDVANYGRFISPSIESASSPSGVTNRWVACKTTDNVYAIGWDNDITSQPPEGCINIAKYNPGVLLHVRYV